MTRPLRSRRPVWIGVGTIVVAALGLEAGAFAWQQSQQRSEHLVKALTGGDSALAPPIIRRYGCGGCHTVSALAGADGKVAAPLDQFRQRVYIGGVVQNTPDNLVRWIVSPRTFSPKTAMPDSGIGDAEARHVAAFLYLH